ncbi:tellurite resistance protein TerC [Clostridium pascui]|uniref:TerC/Alx family metal homeostasis membrane protein n=1 Tax=Clostridium pascui TaxID=46609 RepID=UPI00195AA751|nr:TerC/Alx family metal homeostasis membrane protein [Clostridium pascui]MBM7868577.1 tellurite resistance protein TerC [Clostridium pascui]
MDTKKALKWVLFWVCAAMIFNLGIYFTLGKQKAIEFLGGYVIEQSLSLDNLFLFILVFGSFGIKKEYQRRVLNYGIIGAVILRFIFVLLGVAVVSKFHWVLYIFGAILIISGLKMMFKQDDEEEFDFKNNKLIKLLTNIIPITDKVDGEKFFVKINNVLHATPLLAILVVIEGTDILFAIDSIPAIFSITTDSFIVYTSNIFAILALRSLYFLLVKINDAFKYVKYGVALILVFTGVKLCILMFHVEIQVVLSVAIIFVILLASVLVSIIMKKNEDKNQFSV